MWMKLYFLFTPSLFCSSHSILRFYQVASVSLTASRFVGFLLLVVVVKFPCSSIWRNFSRNDVRTRHSEKKKKNQTRSSLPFCSCIHNVLKAVAPSAMERDEWRCAFYRGAAFPTLARVLIYNVASSWLACFPYTARLHVYDSFFLSGPPIEVVQAVVPGLLANRSTGEDVDAKAVCSNAERLLILCLVEKDGVLDIARGFGDSGEFGAFAIKSVKQDSLIFISNLAQLLVSVPDKAQLNAPAALSSHLFFKKIVIQLLTGAEERALVLCDTMDESDGMDRTFHFVGESFARICRRGSTDIIVVEMVPRLLALVRSCITLNSDSVDPDLISSTYRSLFWMRLIEAIKDPYAVERLSEQLLGLLANENASDVEAYWILWLLFHRTMKHQTSTRSMFVDKFLLWRVFPVCCLRWILQFAVLQCPHSGSGLTRGKNAEGLLERVQCMAGVWSKREFVQTAPLEQQAYLTAAVGLSLEKMSREELEKTKDIMHSILQGVSCRLESPIDLIRRMASCIALVFSKVVDPKNPLYLDDSCKDEHIDWDFGFSGKNAGSPTVLQGTATDKDKTRTHSCPPGKEVQTEPNDTSHHGVRNRKKFSVFKPVNPDEIVDPATLNKEQTSDEDEGDEASENSDATSDTSLEPYDLSDDDVDLKKSFSQLVDIVSALRKTDDPDGVEKALDAVENLVRASPDELQHVSGELVRALLQVRCSDLAVEGEEESAEMKRQKSLVALLITCPFKSLDALNGLLYSPNVDISQRMLILDVMIDAAQELSDAKITRLKHWQKPFISTISETQPWFLPTSQGPAGAGPWKEVSEPGALLSWSYRYERELPSKTSQIKTGKSRRWSFQSAMTLENQMDRSKNKFPLYAAAFMLPAMQGFDKERHGVDLLGRDFVVLGKLIYMLGICMKCTSMHPEASALAPAFLDMLQSREVSHHAEAYVRRSVAFAASCILVALHPAYVASALVEGNPEISSGLEWIRTWALHVSESDTDTECSTLAMTCLQLHSEMALQASRALESTEVTSKANDVTVPSSKVNVRIPSSHLRL